MKNQDAPTLIPLFSAQVRTPVPFKGSVDSSLFCADGELKLDLTNRVVLAKPCDVLKRQPQIIPLENIVCMVELTDAHKKKLAEKEAARAAPPAPRPVPPLEAADNSDRVKFVKDEFGQIQAVKG